MSEVDILYLRVGGVGWGPIDVLAHLLESALDGELITVDSPGSPSILQKISSLLPTRRRRSGRQLLVLASVPGQLAHVATLHFWLRGYSQTSAWVIDSFWTDRIARFARAGQHFDHIFITDRNLVDEWTAATGANVHWMPWGTDTFSTGQLVDDRPVDLVRTGRQPAQWDDDDRTRALAEARGLRFSGRPPFAADPAANQQILWSHLAASKFALAFTNLVDDSTFTHPTRDYLTGRWMDALAAGCTVAGRAPAAAEWTLWEGACVDLDPFDAKRGIEQLREHVNSWTPAVAHRNSMLARERLDWRHRIEEIAGVLGCGVSDQLRRERQELLTGRDRL